jgi:hypothetical protein
MTFLAWMLLFASTSRVDLVDETYVIPAANWRYIELELKQLPVTVFCDYHAGPGSTQVRLALMRRRDLERLRSGRPHGALAVTEAGPRARLDHEIRSPGEYVLVLDNHDETRPAEVHLRVSLDFAARGAPGITYVSPQRKLVVILISFAVFFGIVTWSARRLLEAIRK